LVYNFLKVFLYRGIRGKTILETGSGTGRISLRLAREGAEVLLLDISRDIIKFSKKIFKDSRSEGVFIVGDIFHLPFRSNTLDIVWNSGVLEHYTRTEQRKVFDEAMRVLKIGGSLIIIVPNSEALIYNLFRKLDVKLRRWRFGYEEPISPKELYHLFPSKPITHRSAGFIYQFHFVSLPLLGVALNIWLKFLYRSFPVLTTIDKSIPGYLVAGLWKK
jgi:ubiquinone/menaquinone biosynthesis C-methylase UbiE